MHGVTRRTDSTQARVTVVGQTPHHSRAAVFAVFDGYLACMRHKWVKV